MAFINARLGLDRLEEYEVETVDADIIVNANENNYPMPAPVLEEILERTKNFSFNRYPPMKAETLCRIIADDLGWMQPTCVSAMAAANCCNMACYAFGGAGHKIAYPYPSFSMYGVYAQLADSQGVPFPLDVNGYVDADAVIDFCRQERPALC
jgi:histidinol-phosphate aminotransferase